MRNIVLLCLMWSTTFIWSQKKTTLIDSCIVKGIEFKTYKKNGIACIKAYHHGKEIAIKGKLSLGGSSYFIRERKTNKVFQDDVNVNGDYRKVFLIVGNKAPICLKEQYPNRKFLKDFCGMSVQGIVISGDGIFISPMMYNGTLTCIRENPLSLKDLWTFAQDY